MAACRQCDAPAGADPTSPPSDVRDGTFRNGCSLGAASLYGIEQEREEGFAESAFAQHARYECGRPHTVRPVEQHQGFSALQESMLGTGDAAWAAADGIDVMQGRQHAAR